MPDLKVTLLGDASPLEETLAAFPERISSEVREGLLRLFEVGGDAVVNLNSIPTPGTDEVVVRLEPSDALLRLLAAARAGDA